MIATWMMYCLLCAVGLAAAALVAERALLAGGAPVRHVWVIASVLAIVIPAAAYRSAPRPIVTVSSATAHPAVELPPAFASDIAPPQAVIDAARSSSSGWNVRG